jgi:sterol desaturase/sphingolipid hydroxylase (fatty acid hydroxylase superfamily)
MITIVTFLAAGLLTYGWLVVRKRAGVSVAGLLGHFFPWRRLKNRSTIVDFVIYLASKFTQRFIAVAAIAVTVAMAKLTAGELAHLLHMSHKLSAGPVAITVISLAMFVCADFGEFYSHYLQHKIPWLWQFHKVHHSALFLTPLTSARFHPVGNLLDGLLMSVCLAIPAGFAAFFFALSFVKLLAMAAGVQAFFSIGLLTALQHSHFDIGFGPLEWVFISPRMHQLHHSTRREHWDKNMASRLAIWDWLFGTGFRLPKGETVSFGLGTIEDQRGDYQSIWWCYAGPLIGCYYLLRKSLLRPQPQTER